MTAHEGRQRYVAGLCTGTITIWVLFWLALFAWDAAVDAPISQLPDCECGIHIRGSDGKASCIPCPEKR